MWHTDRLTLIDKVIQRVPPIYRNYNFVSEIAEPQNVKKTYKFFKASKIMEKDKLSTN